MKKCSCGHWMGECDECGGPVCPACHDRGFRTECPRCWGGARTKPRSRVQVKPADKFSQFVVALSKHMMRELGYKLKSVNINGSNGGRHKFVRSTKTHRLFYGKGLIDEVAENTMSDTTPKSYRYLWSGKAGKRAVYELVVHEVAHAVQSEKGERHYYSAHNAAWVDAVHDLFDRFPYDDIKNLE